MKSPRIFALATVIAITLSAMPNNTAALTRAAGGSKVKYMTASTAGSVSSAATILRAVIMAVDNYLWFPH